MFLWGEYGAYCLKSPDCTPSQGNYGALAGTTTECTEWHRNGAVGRPTCAHSSVRVNNKTKDILLADKRRLNRMLGALRHTTIVPQLPPPQRLEQNARLGQKTPAKELTVRSSRQGPTVTRFHTSPIAPCRPCCPSTQHRSWEPTQRSTLSINGPQNFQV